MQSFLPAVIPPTALPEPAWWFIFADDRLLVTITEEKAYLPSAFSGAEIGVVIAQAHYLGTLDGRACFTASVQEKSLPPEGMQFQGLRRLWEKLDEDLFGSQGGPYKL